jgi:polysaccharide biosynthesis protein VpsM
MPKSYRLLPALPLLLIPLYSHAQEASAALPTTVPSVPSEPEEGGRPLRFGNVNVFPMAELRWGHDDNITQAPDTASQPAQSSAIWVLNAGVTADLEHKGDRYSLQYLGAYTRYTASSLDNINSHTLRLQGANTLNVRHAVRWEAGLVDSFDPRGSTDATMDVQAPSHYQTYRMGGTYVYGAEGAKGRIEADAFFSNKEYKNNRETMATADVDSTELNGRYYWRVMPKTSAAFELRYANYDYVAANAGLDSSGLQVLVGANWNATAATSGRFRIGHTSRRYDSRGDFSGTSWEGAVTWKPLTYSIFTFTTGRAISDTSSGPTGTVGDYVLGTTQGLSWTHEWRSNLRSDMSWNHTKSEYAGVGRLDKLDVYKAGLYYDFRRWMNAGVELNYSQRRSSNPDYTFDRLQSLAVVRAKF